MKIFIDANIIVSVLNKEYPVFTYAARVLSLPASRNIQLYTSSCCIAIAYYFACKKSGAGKARQKIALLAQHIKLAENKQQDVQLICTNKKIKDFEDGLQYYAAANAGCKCIITGKVKDYYFSDI